MERILRTIAGAIAGYIIFAAGTLIVAWIAVRASGLQPFEPAPISYVAIMIAATPLIGWLAGRGLKAVARYGTAVAAPIAIVMVFASSARAILTPNPAQPRWFPVLLTLLAVAGIMSGALPELWKRTSTE